MTSPPPSWRALSYLVLLAFITLITVLYTLSWARGTRSTSPSHIWSANHAAAHSTPTSVDSIHPISHLITKAEKSFYSLLTHQTHSLAAAASAYRTTRGRHPPPGFDHWHAYATAHNATIIETFFDAIYSDIAPFWSIPPRTLRSQARSFSDRLSLHHGRVEVSSFDEHAALNGWKEMFETLVQGVAQMGAELPDVELPMNVNDEPAMLVPWEEVDTALQMSRKFIPSADETVTNFSVHSDLGETTFDPEWYGPRRTHGAKWLGPLPIWSLIRPACPPGSRSRKEVVFNDIWAPDSEASEAHSAASILPTAFPAASWIGFAENWTNVIDACAFPQLQGLHAAFVAPENMAVTTKLFPLFGAAPFHMGNEIVVPGAKEWRAFGAGMNDESAMKAWEERRNVLFWRGNITTGHNYQRYWQRFQRERFVSMMNSSHVQVAEERIRGGREGIGPLENFKLLTHNLYSLFAQEAEKLADWVTSWVDVAFTDVPSYMEQYFSAANNSTGDAGRNARFTISLDENGGDDGGGFARQLTSGKVVLRASVFRRWFDERLTPWVHYVPVDNTLVDVYGVMDYFLNMEVDDSSRSIPIGTGKTQPRGEGAAAAWKIAENGKQWAEQVLRQEDMLIYIYRLVLEYARILDDRRDRLGWAGDLIKEST